MRVSLVLLCLFVLCFSFPQRVPGRGRGGGRGGGGRRGAEGGREGGRCRDGSPRPCCGGQTGLGSGGLDHRGCWAGARSRDKFCCSGATPTFDGHNPATRPCPLSDNGGSP